MLETCVIEDCAKMCTVLSVFYDVLRKLPWYSQALLCFRYVYSLTVCLNNYEVILLVSYPCELNGW